MKKFQLILLMLSFLFCSNFYADEEVEELVVTAQKKEERYIDVPLSVQTLTEENLQISGVSLVQELVKASPSVTYSRTPGMRGDGVYIRGIGTNLYQSGVEPTVSTVVDGVVLGRTFNFLSNLIDIERVEILRGPQGTLFGKNASGGVINVITKKPTQDPSSDFYVTVGDNSEQNVTAVLGGALGENLSGRITVFDKSRDGYITNKYSGPNAVSDFNGNDSQGFRLKLLWALDDTEVLFTADDSEQNRPGFAFVLNSMPGPGPLNAFYPQDVTACGVTPGPENTDVCMDLPATAHMDQDGVSLTITKETEDFIFTSITSKRNAHHESEQDIDSTPTALSAPGRLSISRNGGSTDTEQTTQEFQLTNAEPGKLDYVLGLYFFEQDLHRNFNRHVGICPVPPPAGGWLPTSTCPIEVVLKGYFNTDVNSKNWAVFGQTTYELNDNLDLIAGLRYTKDDLSYVFDRPTGPIIIPNAPAWAGSDSGSENDVSGKLGLKLTTDDNTMLYATYSTGYKSPGWDIIFGMSAESAAKQPVRAETSSGIELGLKKQLLDNRVLLSLAFFDTEFEDYQQQSFLEDQAVFALSNVGAISTRGVELDFMAKISPNFYLNGGIAFTDATIDDFKGAACWSGQSAALGCAGGQQDLSGSDVPFAPELKFTIQGRYDKPLTSGARLFITSSYMWQDEFIGQWDHHPGSVTDSYGLLNASVGIDKDNWTVELYSKNLLDEFYHSNQTVNILGSTMFVNQDYTTLWGVNFKLAL